MRAGEGKGRKKREGERLVLSRKNILWNSPEGEHSIHPRKRDRIKSSWIIGLGE